MTRASVIYVVGAERLRAPVKIGLTTMLERRLDQLRVSHPEDLFILAHGPGSRAEEQALHRLLTGDRLRGEWFKRSASVIILIDFLNSDGRVCDLLAEWKLTKPVSRWDERQRPARDRFLQRQVRAQVKKPKYDEWDAKYGPA